MKRLQDRVAIITGGASGIGYVTAKRFLEEGAIVVVADYNEEKLNESVKNLQEFGQVLGIKVDISKREDVEKMAEETVKNFGKIDILINNAGITLDARLVNMTDEQWDRVYEINQKGVYMCAQVVAKYMVEKQYGRIINASSIVGRYGNFGQFNYAATKAAVIAMAQSGARELGKEGITFNAVAPGFIQTEMTDKMPEKVLTAMKEKTPVKRLGQPIDIANAYVFLASDEASFINGTVLSVDGGLVM